MSPFVTLLVTSLLMGITSFAAGYFPLILPLSEIHVRRISTVGIGVLIGTALVVIIPEGVETVYTSNSDKNTSNRPCVGISLLLGFVMMYTIDKIPRTDLFSFGFGSKKRDDSVYMRQMPTEELERNEIDQAVDEELRGLNINDDRIDPPEYTPTQSLSTVIGLVIHAVADGVALGASVSSGIAALEFIVFIAIMIHKAPASFGLSTVLMRDNHPRSKVLLYLGVFASAAPVGAILTYLFIYILGSDDPQLLLWWTGSLLVFSGGTFLFVAMHVMEELNEGPSSSTNSDLMLSLAGMCLPLVTLLVPDAD